MEASPAKSTHQSAALRAIEAQPTASWQLPGQSKPKPDEAESGDVTLMQRFGSAANLNIHLHCLVLDGVYRRSADCTPEFAGVDVDALPRARGSPWSMCLSTERYRAREADGNAKVTPEQILLGRLAKCFDIER